MLISFLFSNPILFVIGVAAIVYAITVHEFSHALAGKLEGDHTAESMGRLTLNPISHIDPWGFLLIIFIGFGWGKPVPFNPYNIKHRRWGPTFISLAGPLSNIASVILFGLILKLVVAMELVAPGNYLIVFLQWLILLNAILAVFNLLPIPPLDGSKLLFSILPRTPNALKLQMFLEKNGMFLLIGLLILDSFGNPGVLGTIFFWIRNLLFNLFL